MGDRKAPTPAPSERPIVATRPQLAAAFTEWLRRYEKEPARFAAEYGEAVSYGESCADYLVRMIKEAA
jgi:hypothetical protein